MVTACLLFPELLEVFILTASTGPHSIEAMTQNGTSLSGCLHRPDSNRMLSSSRIYTDGASDYVRHEIFQFVLRYEADKWKDRVEMGSPAKSFSDGSVYDMTRTAFQETWDSR